MHDILIDGREFVTQQRIEGGNNPFVPFHIKAPFWADSDTPAKVKRDETVRIQYRERLTGCQSILPEVMGRGINDSESRMYRTANHPGYGVGVG
jgi:hypothetical protein